MDNAMNKPEPQHQAEGVFWHSILGHQTDTYDLHRQMGQEQQVYRENRLSQHITPHLLDQAVGLHKIVKRH